MQNLRIQQVTYVNCYNMKKYYAIYQLEIVSR